MSEPVGDTTTPKMLNKNDVFANFGRRVKNGYDPGRVERHLRKIADGVDDLVGRINGDQEVSESVELVMKATRQSVDTVLSDARGRAKEIVGYAESQAATIKISAEDAAQSIRQATEADIAERIRDAESKLGAINELIDSRQAILREFEDKVATRLAELRSASDSIRDQVQSVAIPSVIDLTDQGDSNVAHSVVPNGSDHDSPPSSQF